jgi:hypothetical protein
LAILAAILRCLILAEQLGRRAAARLILEIDISEFLTATVREDETGVRLFNTTAAAGSVALRYLGGPVLSSTSSLPWLDCHLSVIIYASARGWVCSPLHLTTTAEVLLRVDTPHNGGGAVVLWLRDAETASIRMRLQNPSCSEPHVRFGARSCQNE